MAPSKAALAERKLKIRAFLIEKPPWISTPKSPSSWGISWNKTAIVVARPRLGLTE